MVSTFRTGPQSDVARQLRCRLQGLHRAAFWRAQGFPNLARARAVQAKLRAQRRREEAARQFSPHALELSKFGERYEDLLPLLKRSLPRGKQVYKSRLKVLRSCNKPSAHPRAKQPRERSQPTLKQKRGRWQPPKS